MAENKVVSSLEKAAARDARAAERQAKFDKLPVSLQLLAGIGILAVIAAAGIGFLYLIDGTLLDLDPIGALISSLF